MGVDYGPQAISFGESGKRLSIHKFGANADVDALESIHELGGMIVYPTAGEALEVVSSSANDAAAGTGQRTMFVEGVNGDNAWTREKVTLNGTTAVALTTEFKRVFRARGIEAGSGGVNAGTITVRTVVGSTERIRITAGKGTSFFAGYTIPAGYRAWVLALHMSSDANASAVWEAQLAVRPYGESWYTAHAEKASNDTPAEHDTGWALAGPLAAGSDFELRCLPASGVTNVSIFGTMTIVMEPCGCAQNIKGAGMITKVGF